MPIYPKIQSPCPYQDKLAAIMDGDMCRLCQRQVFDLTDWSDGERVSFLSSCQEQVCVSYRVPARSAIAIAALAAAALPSALAAQATSAPAPVATVTSAELAAQTTNAEQAMPAGEIVVLGGKMLAPGDARYVEVPADEALPALPVAYDDPPARPAPPVAPATRRGPAR
jgi:predicted Fe-S protein YdhL (DUF1289 family)